MALKFDVIMGDVRESDELNPADLSETTTLENTDKALVYKGGILQLANKTLFAESPIAYKHPRGDAEYVGNAVYSTTGTIKMIGMFYTPAEALTFKIIDLKAYGTTDTVLEARVYRKLNFANNDTFSSLTLIKTFNLNAGEVNTDANGFLTLELDSPIDLLANESIIVMINPSVTEISMKYWQNAISSNPARTAFLYSTLESFTSNNATWTNPSSLATTPFILRNKVGATTEDIDAAITTNNNTVVVLKSEIDYPRMVVPENIYVSEDRELNLWNNSLAHNSSNIDLEIIGAKGKSIERCYRYTGLNADIGTTTVITVKAKNKNGTTLQTKTFNLKPIAKNTGAGVKQILFIGDSLTFLGETDYVKEIKDLFTADGGASLYLLGTQGTTYKHEGRPGWSFDTFVGNTSPFYNDGDIDFTNYMSVNSNFGGSNVIDLAVIQLGVNDCFSNTEFTTQVTTIISNAKLLISGLLADYPTCKVLISLPPSGSDTNNGWGDNYGAVASRFIFEKNIRLLYETFIAEFDAAAYNANVFVCPSFLSVDRNNGYAKSDIAISARFTTTEPQHTNGVHPTTSGYNQIADIVYSHLRAII